jgi:hypothetical protein
MKFMLNTNIVRMQRNKISKLINYVIKRENQLICFYTYFNKLIYIIHFVCGPKTVQIILGNRPACDYNCPATIFYKRRGKHERKKESEK